MVFECVFVLGIYSVYDTRTEKGFRYIARGFWERDGELLALATLDEAAGFFGPSLQLRAFRWNKETRSWNDYIQVHDNTINNFPPMQLSSGDEATCREYINLIRSRPGVDMSPVTEAGEALLTRLQHERQIELVFEGHRYFDVRRWKIAPDVLNKLPKRMDIVKNLDTGKKTYTVNVMENFKFIFTEKNYLVPIPQEEIDKNPLLEQNPGY